MKEFAPSGAEYCEWIIWMQTIPLSLETDDLRVVHACWNQHAVDRLSAEFSGRCLAATQLAPASDETTALAIDVYMLPKRRLDDFASKLQVRAGTLAL
jgi:hypothetical protein